MGEVEQWLPNAIQAGTAVGQLWLGLTGRRQEQAADWGAMLEELADLDGPELRRVVEENPAVAELIGIAWEAAARTASEDKRYLLAQVAAAALREDDLADIDAIGFLTRTVIALDPAHIKLLVITGTPSAPDRLPDRMEADGVIGHYITREEVENRWSGSTDLIPAATAALEREGLIRDQYAAGRPSGRIGWALSDYGRRFLDYLLVDAGGWPPKQ
jgi:hypothetical protein